MGGSDTRLGEEVEYVPALLAQGHGHGEDSLHETAAVSAVGSEASLPVEHGGPDGALGGIVRGLDAFDANEGPHRRSHLEDHLAHPLGLGLTAASPFPKKCFDLLTDRTHVDRETGPGESSISDAAPKCEHLFRFAKEGCADLRSLGPALGESFEISDQVGPTDLTTTDAPAVVAVPAIRGEVAGEYSQQSPSCIRAAVDMDQEHADPRRNGGPQPGPLASLAPSCLVGVDAGLGLHKVSGRFDRSRQSLADRLLGGGDRACGHADVKEVFERLASRPFGQAQFPSEVGDHGLKGGPLHPRGDSPRQLRHRPMGALRADQAMKQILDDLGVGRGNLRDLMSKRRRIFSREAVPASLALLRLEGDDVVNLLDRHELVRGALVTGLTSRRPPGGWLGATRRSRRRIARGRTRGVLRVLVEAGFKTLDPLLLGGQLRPELRDQSKAGSVNVVLLFPRLHLSIEHGNGKIDSSEMIADYDFGKSGWMATVDTLSP